MIARLDDATFYIILAATFAGAGTLGWLGEAILRSHAFGAVVNTILAAIGGFGALFLMDWTYQRGYLSSDYVNAYAGVVAVASAGTAVLVVCCLARVLLRR